MINRWLLYQASRAVCGAAPRSISPAALRVPRPAAGRAGAALPGPASRARAFAARRSAAVRRRRRPALVAPARRSGRAHPLLGRPALAEFAALLYVRVTGDDRSSDEKLPFLTAACSEPNEHEDTTFRTCRTRPVRSTNTASRGRVQPVRRRPRVAADRHRRLERRHEPGRCRGQRRERLAGWFLVTILGPFADAPTHAATYRAAAFGGRRRCQRRRRRMGRRVVPPRVFRRRHAARLRGERGVPDRFDRAVLGVISAPAIPNARACDAVVDRDLVREEDGSSSC